MSAYQFPATGVLFAHSSLVNMENMKGTNPSRSIPDPTWWGRIGMWNRRAEQRWWRWSHELSIWTRWTGDGTTEINQLINELIVRWSSKTWLKVKRNKNSHRSVQQSLSFVVKRVRMRQRPHGVREGRENEINNIKIPGSTQVAVPPDSRPSSVI